MSVILTDTLKARVVGAAVTTEKGLNVGGACTATSFVGNVTGNASGTAGGLTGTPDITVNNIVGVAATFTGVLTYEDVTNVDSVGIITARSGIEFGAAGVGGTITAVGNAEFVGITTIGSDLSISDKIIHTGDTDTAIRFAGTDTITAETAGSERVRIQSNGYVGVGTNSASSLLDVSATNTTVWPFTADVSNVYAYSPYPHELQIQNHARDTTGAFAGIYFHSGASADGSYISAARIAAIDSGDYKSDLAFGTRDTNFKERLRITSGGNLLINGTSSADSNNLLELHQTYGGRIGLARNDTSTAAGNNLGQINFYGNDANGTYEISARIEANADLDHGTGDKPGRLVFKTTPDGSTTPSERLRIGSAGQLGIAGANYGTSGQVLTSGGASAAPQWADAGGGAWEVVSTTALSGSTSDLQLYGWSNTYAQYKVVFQDCYNSSDIKMRIRFYTDATSGQNGTLVTSGNYAYVGGYITWNSTSGPNMEAGNNDYFYPYTTASGGSAEIYTGELIFPMKTSGYNDAVKCYGTMMAHNAYWPMISCELNANTTHFLTGIHIYFIESGNTNPLSPSTGRITLLRMKYS